MQIPSNMSLFNLSLANQTDQELGLIDTYNDEIFQNHLLPSFIYIIFLIIVGIPGNILVCYIYLSKLNRSNQKKRRRNTPRLKTSDIFIIALACFDLISCSVAMPIELKLLLNYVRFDHPWLCKISRGVSMFCTTSTSFVLLAYAVSRFIGISLRFRDIEITGYHAKIIVFLATVVSVPLTVPIFIIYGTFVYPISNGENGKTCLVLNNIATTKVPLILTICLTTFHLLFDFVFITLYALICGKVAHSKQRMSTLRRGNSEENSSERRELYKMARKSSALSSQDEHSPFDTSPQKSSEGLFSFDLGTEESSRANPTYNKNSSNGKISRKLCNKPRLFSRQSTKSMRSMTSEVTVHGKRYKVGRTTFMLFIVTLGFMVTFAPYCVIALMRSLNPTFYFNQTHAQKAVFQLFLRSYFLSSAINPVIYSFLSQSFRIRCKDILKNLINCIS